MRLILTKEWLYAIEQKVNEHVINLLEDYKSRHMLFELPFAGPQNWTMESATQLASLQVRSARKVCSINNFIDKNTKVSLKIRVGADFYYGEGSDDYMGVELLMFWCGDRYVTMGMLIPVSEYSKVAAMTNYKIEIACSRGLNDFGSLFMVWYYNDSKKKNGKYTMPTLPLDIGCTNWYQSNCNIGWGSENLTIHGNPDLKWATDVQRFAVANGNPGCVFDFWGGWR